MDGITKVRRYALLKGNTSKKAANDQKRLILGIQAWMWGTPYNHVMYESMLVM
jgi:hypothetical protein